MLMFTSSVSSISSEAWLPPEVLSRDMFSVRKHEHANWLDSVRMAGPHNALHILLNGSELCGETCPQTYRMRLGGTSVAKTLLWPRGSDGSDAPMQER